MRAALCLLVCAWSGLAVADAVPGPPPCPKGQIGVATHDRNGCYDPPPKDCPAGWFPELGGRCVVRVCKRDEECGEGLQCKSATACMHDEMQRTGPRGSGPPIKVAIPVGVCGGAVECPDDNECRKAKVCIPKGADQPTLWKNQPKPTKPKAGSVPRNPPR